MSEADIAGEEGIAPPCVASDGIELDGVVPGCIVLDCMVPDCVVRVWGIDPGGICVEGIVPVAERPYIRHLQSRRSVVKVNECMTREVRIVDPADTLEQAARAMADIDAGFLPVGKNDRLIGVITDRDIVIRAFAVGRVVGATIRDIMSESVQYCYVDEDVDEILTDMADLQVRRLPVLDRDERLVGVISISDLACNGEAARAGEALGDITRRTGLHSQVI